MTDIFSGPMTVRQNVTVLWLFCFKHPAHNLANFCPLDTLSLAGSSNCEIFYFPSVPTPLDLRTISVGPLALEHKRKEGGREGGEPHIWPERIFSQ